ncbi:PH domain-containing protein [Calidifontibacter terrae]
MSTVTDPYAVFRPRVGRWFAIGSSAACVVGFAVLALSLPRGGASGWTDLDAFFVFLFGLAFASFLLRYAFIKAVPTPSGLLVRNLFVTRELDWAQIVGVQFGGGIPWLTLDLADTEQLAVMAVQRADGGFATAESERMAALVQALGSAASDSPDSPEASD